MATNTRRYTSSDRRPLEQSSAPRATLRFSLGAGVTPAARRAGDGLDTREATPRALI
jgi:hypothetical protein